jgi:uridine kinase
MAKLVPTRHDLTRDWHTFAQVTGSRGSRLTGITLPPTFPTSYGPVVLEPLIALAERTGVKAMAVAGPAGAGKSTLVKALSDYFRTSGRAVISASLDDFYYSRAKRTELGFVFRASPGSHDIESLRMLLSDARAGVLPLVVPQFDASIDDCGEPKIVRAKPDLVLIDGWFLGLSAMGYDVLIPEFDLFVHLRIPEALARARRFSREDELRRRTGKGYTPEQMEQFWQEVLGPGGASWVADSEAHADVVISFLPDGEVEWVRGSDALRAAIRSVDGD